MTAAQILSQIELHAGTERGKRVDTQATLSNKTFAAIELKNIDFLRMVLNGTKFIEDSITQTSFKLSILDNSTFDNCKILDSSICNCSLIRVFINRVTTQSVDFEQNMMINGAIFGFSGTNVKLKRSMVKDTTISHTMLKEGRISFCRFQIARFHEMDFENCVFENVSFDACTFKDVMFKKCSFINCDIIAATNKSKTVRFNDCSFRTTENAKGVKYGE